MEEKRETVTLNGNFCQFREQEYSEQWKRIREEINLSSKRETNSPNYNGLICPLCNGELKIGEMIYMVMNNQKLFPNCVIHKSCVVGGLEDTTKTLKYKYFNYKQILEENKAWI